MEILLPAPQALVEAMTFGQLWQGTRDAFPSRLHNAKFVKAYQPRALIIRDDSIVCRYNYISQPSTEGKSHYGYVQFFPSKEFVKKNGRMQEIISVFKKAGDKRKDVSLYGKQIPFQKVRAVDLQGMFCKVSCDCRDFLYRHEVALHSHGASDIKFSNGEDPIHTNPGKRPALCKHLLSCITYLVNGSSLDVDMDLPSGMKVDPYKPNTPEVTTPPAPPPVAPPEPEPAPASEPSNLVTPPAAPEPTAPKIPAHISDDEDDVLDEHGLPRDLPTL